MNSSYSSDGIQPTSYRSLSYSNTLGLTFLPLRLILNMEVLKNGPFVTHNSLTTVYCGESSIGALDWEFFVTVNLVFFSSTAFE